MANTNKSTVLHAVKAIAVLVVICLVCCLLLAICNDLLYVSEDVKLERNLQKVYPNFEMKGKVPLDSEFASNPVYGEVLRVIDSPVEGSYVIQAKGAGGFSGGNVTVLVGVKMKHVFSTGKDEPVIVGVAILDNEGQSFIGNITQKHLDTWYVGQSVTAVQDTTGRGSGASFTENALNNAINMVGYYCMNALGLGANPEGDARKAAVALLTEKGVANTDLTGASNILKVSAGDATVVEKLSDGADVLTYFFVGNGVQAFVYGEDDGRKIVAVAGNNVYTSANVAEKDAIVAKVQQNKIHVAQLNTQAGPYTAYAMLLGVAEADGVSTYTVAGLAVGTMPQIYILEVAVVADGGKGKVQSITATKNGFVDGQPAQSKTDLMLSALVGTTSATIKGTYDGKAGEISGASESANLITVAVMMALDQFDNSNN